MKTQQFRFSCLLLINLAICAWRPAISREPSAAATLGMHGDVEISEVHESLADWNDPLSKTVIRFFESQANYLPGDLIVRSQVADLQAYLRKTHGASSATNPQLRRRVLVDRACLARVYYGLGGDRLLREAAGKMGGYGPLDRLCQSKAGRALLTTAVNQSNLNALLDYFRKQELLPPPVRVSHGDRGEHEKKQLVRKLSKIYTVEELLKAIHASPTE